MKGTQGPRKELCMTSAELVSELRRIHDRFDWSLGANGRICGKLKEGRPGRFDPITALVFAKTGAFFAEGRLTEAADSMGLNRAACAEIIAASNYEWDPCCTQGELRQ